MAQAVTLWVSGERGYDVACRPHSTHARDTGRPLSTLFVRSHRLVAGPKVGGTALTVSRHRTLAICYHDRKESELG